MAQAWLAMPVDLYLQATARAKEIAGKLQQRDRAMTRQLLTSARVERGQVVIALATAAIADAVQLTVAADGPASITLHADGRLTRSGRAMRLVDTDGAHQTAAPQASLVRLLAQAHRYWRELRKGEVNVSSWRLRKQSRPLISPACSDWRSCRPRSPTRSSLARSGAGSMRSRSPEPGRARLERAGRSVAALR
ncbi:hypothetical protein [uncultured Sphingomonas sp.]|uniref:hypothetical protein n=1 Tax=uncultured Sphingomonas sp. TaxID=158754 RepID=UPI0035CAE4CA